MRIDFHTHIWNHQLDQVQDFVKALDTAGVDKAAIMPIAPHGSNEDIARCVEQAPDRLIGFASVVPHVTPLREEHDPVAELEDAVTRLGLRGLKLHPLIQGFAINDPGIVPTIEAAGELGIPVLIHTGPAYVRSGRTSNADIYKLDDLAITCPDTTLVAGHGDPFMTGPHIARKHPNVFLETSFSWADLGGLIPGLAKRAIEIAGPEKVLYGSDFSLGREERLTTNVEILINSGVGEEDLEAVLGGNAQRLLGL